MISIYETETFSLVDKKSLKVENVLDFIWSPNDPILALFVPELGGGNQPARVSLVQLPSKEELRQKNLFSGQLEFYNVDELETMATTEHFMATDIEWDPICPCSTGEVVGASAADNDIVKGSRKRRNPFEVCQS